MQKVGVLATSTAVAVAVATAYTCPAGRTARVQVDYRGVSGSSSELRINVAGKEVMRTGALTSGHVHYSSRQLIYNTQTAASAINGSSDALTQAPAPHVWLLSGDASGAETVTFEIVTAVFSAMRFNVVGTEMRNLY